METTEKVDLTKGELDNCSTSSSSNSDFLLKTAGPGSHIDRQIQDLYERVRRLEDAERQRSQRESDLGMSPRPSGKASLQQTNKGGMEIGPIIHERAEDDLGDVEEYEEPWTYTPLKPSPLLGEKENEKQMIDDAVQEAIQQSQRAFEEIIEEGKRRLQESLQQGQDQIHEGIRQIIGKINESVPHTEKNGGGKPNEEEKKPWI
jgi:hypothetical protein